METLTIGFLLTLFVGLIVMNYLSRDPEDIANIKQQNRRVHRGGPSNDGPGGPGPQGGIY